MPIVHSYIELQKREGVCLQFIQDGASGHSAEYTKEELLERGIIPIFWPAFSPDLNPIEHV